MHKVFISYHHANDQWYKNELVKFNEQHHIFDDQSIDTGDIDDDLDENARTAKTMWSLPPDMLTDRR
jgi:hypothetical protein